MLPDNIIGWLVVGLVAGALGKLIMPGRDPGGLIVTILLGVLGALLAYYLAPLVGLETVRTNPSWTNTIIASTVGALILLILYRLVVARR
ncbi:GlsB/YeaQ/YmgE family stress response membrane protein [Sphingomonas sp. HF-S3]|jgi:uncharacterized membrane protein YeaQ/YmgE (transglycosylase-associated protein family)|uniref:GlsB/YeaQ/YmgE family stress response membrane protein n=1 Tax=Sphingomonas rustica TaxID=3103142 RepID=A0ABV0B480_9SPHN